MNPQQEIQLLEQLIDQLLAGIQEFLQSGEILSDEFQGQIAQELELATTRLYELQSQNPAEGLQPTQAQPDKLRMERPMPSSNVHSLAYDDKKQNLFVKFQDKWPGQNGPVYEYGGVPKNIVNLLQSGAIPARTDGQNKWGKWWKGKVPSLGASLFTLIKGGGYPYQRLS